MAGCTTTRITELTMSPEQIRSVGSWEKLFLEQWDKELRIASPKSLSADSWDLYSLSYSIDANITMLQATGKTQYLDRALFYVENVISKAQQSKKLPNSQFKDSYLGWSNHSSPSQGNDGREYPLFESFLWRYVSKMLYIICEREDIAQSTKYAQRYQDILNFTEKHIYEKWSSRGKNNLYRSNAHMFSHWAVISLNLYDITEKEEYLVVVEDFVKKLRSRQTTLYTKNDIKVFHWDPVWNRSFEESQDVGHGNAVIGLIVDLYERDMFYDKDDITGLIELFNSVIWKDSETFAAFFDGSGDGSGWFTDGFIKLGRYSKPLQLRIEKHNRGRSTQFFGNGALNSDVLNSQTI